MSGHPSSAGAHAGWRETEGVLRALGGGIDPLLLGRWEKPEDHVAEEVSRALQGAKPDVTGRIVHLLEEECGHQVRGHIRGIDRLTARLMAHVGVDPLVLSWLATISNSVAHAERDGQPVACIDLADLHHHADSLTQVVLSPRVTWQAHGSLLLTVPLLQSVVVQIRAGTPLSEIVSHPLLDELCLGITSVHTHGEMTWIDVRRGHQARRCGVSARELAAMRPSDHPDATP